MKRMLFYATQPEELRVALVDGQKLYDLDILKEDIQDHNYNTTRFIVLSKLPFVHDHANKISLVLRLAHEPQALYRVLDVIAKRGINMLKIESRPIPDKPWAYMFYIDIEGSLKDEIVSDMIEELHEKAHSVTLLGNYYSRNGVSK